MVLFFAYSKPTPLGKDDSTLAVNWEPLNATMSSPINYLDITTKLDMKRNPEHERMEFWDDLYQQYNGNFV